MVHLPRLYNRPDPWVEMMAKDRELQDHERAHSGKPGAKARHGANITGSNVTGQHNGRLYLKHSTLPGLDPYYAREGDDD